MGQPDSNASIIDVAARAGVSTATVSRVINNPEVVATETAGRVRRAIAELRYRPNLFAQGLSSRRSHALGLMLPEPAGVFDYEILRGAEREACTLGYRLLVTTPASLDAANLEGSPVTSEPADGLMMIASRSAAVPERVLRRWSHPLVVIGATGDGGADSVLADHSPGIRAAIAHLSSIVEPGRIVFVGGAPSEPWCSPSSVFVECMRSFGHDVSEEQVVSPDDDPGWARTWLGNRDTTRLVRGGSIIAAGDALGAAIVDAARCRGLLMSGELRVVICGGGFPVCGADGVIRVPARELGAAASRLLVLRVHEPDRQVQRVTIATEFHMATVDT